MNFVCFAIWIPVQYDVCLPVWCLSTCIYNVCLPIRYYVFATYLMSPYLCDVCLPSLCLASCTYAVCLPAFYDILLSVWYCPACMMPSYLYDLCLLVLCMLTSMLSAYPYILYLPTFVISAYLHICLLLWSLPTSMLAYLYNVCLPVLRLPTCTCGVWLSVRCDVLLHVWCSPTCMSACLSEYLAIYIMSSYLSAYFYYVCSNTYMISAFLYYVRTYVPGYLFTMMLWHLYDMCRNCLMSAYRVWYLPSCMISMGIWVHVCRNPYCLFSVLLAGTFQFCLPASFKFCLPTSVIFAL